MKPLSMWEATSNHRKDRPHLQGDTHCDVVIIGGGYTGLSAAYHLQKKNVKAIIVEKWQAGQGASGRNGGEVLTGYIGSMEAWEKKKGLESAKMMWQLSLDSIHLIEDIINKHQIRCDFKRNGDLFAAYKPGHMDALKRDQEYMARVMNYHDIKIVEKEDLPSEMNTSFYQGGRIDYGSAHFHPLNYALGLAEAVEEMGGIIYENSPAIKIERNSGKVTVTTPEGRVIADELVIATNGYADDVNPTIKKSVIPIESIMISTEPLPEELAEDIIKNDRAIHDTKRLLYYFRRTSDHRLAFGGSGRASSKRDQKNLFHQLHQGMLKVFPQLKGVRVEYQWGGKVGFTKEMIPYMGRLEDGTYFGFGYCGHGAAMSSLFGKMIADHITNEGLEDNPLMIDQLKPIPFHSHHAKAVGILKFYKKLQDAIS
ncbi:NAD(P)/FAD-dependent oxidoreductase [Siminovitchia sediminis]|uniref:NAD(P)/FAD-dependent oxidoreductase n=1 Tax=Siminovitchia sediminis TaxID=1274353 RepID=A0ABW4KHD3_9BACI